MSPKLPASSPPRGPRLLRLSLLLLLGMVPGPRPGSAFYLPGLAPVNFCDKDKESDECKVGEAWRAPGALSEGEVTSVRRARVPGLERGEGVEGSAWGGAGWLAAQERPGSGRVWKIQPWVPTLDPVRRAGCR
jgi:hypothetical protein